MNYQDTLSKMIAAAATAAKGHWQPFRDYLEQELIRLAGAGTWVETDYLADRAAAYLQKDPGRRADLEAKAKLRAELAFDSLRLAAEAVTIAAEADAKIAAQDAINAALAVLKSAINESIGLAIL